MLHPAKLASALALSLFAVGCATTRKEPPPEAGLIPEPVVATVAIQPEPVIAPPPAPTPPPLTVPAESWIQLDRWAQSNQLGTMTNLTGTPAPAFALTTTGGVFALQVGSLIARWAGLELRLGFAPQFIGGEPFLHRLDVQKNLIPLLRPPELASGPRLIVLDPGHGGSDSGARSTLAGKVEKNYTLDWARRLKPLLEQRGWQVLLTRTDDTDLPLPNRVTFGETNAAGLFLSLHFNATTGGDQAGVETYCLTPTGMPSALTRGYEDNVALNFPNNHFDAENLQLAVRIQREILAATGAQDRGVRHARFMTVLRGQSRPAVLIEGGYLSNPREAALIDSPEYRQKLAEAVAQALQSP